MPEGSCYHNNQWNMFHWYLAAVNWSLGCIFAFLKPSVVNLVVISGRKTAFDVFHSAAWPACFAVSSIDQRTALWTCADSLVMPAVLCDCRVGQSPAVLQCLSSISQCGYMPNISTGLSKANWKTLFKQLNSIKHKKWHGHKALGKNKDLRQIRFFKTCTSCKQRQF